MAADEGPFSEPSPYTLDRAPLRLLPESFCRRNNVAVPGRVDAEA